MSFDPKCYELAEYFLSDRFHVVREKDIHELAQKIQDTVEDYDPDVDPTPWEADLRGSNRDEWKHEAAEQQRIK